MNLLRQIRNDALACIIGCLAVIGLVTVVVLLGWLLGWL